jgi:hypothetical protein
MVATGVLAVCASAHLSPRAAVCRLVVACATGAGIVLGLALALYPYGLGFWIAGLRRHASLTTGFSESGLAGIPAYWLADMRSPFLLLTLGLALHGVIRTVFPGDAAPRTAGRWSRVAALSAAAAIGAYTIGHRPEQVYYAMSLMPLWCAMIIAGRPGGCTARLGQGMPRRELIGVLVLLLAGSGFLLAILQFQGYLRHGLALPEARSLFARMRDAHPGRVSVTSALWALADDPATLLLYEGHPERARASDVVIVQQANSGRLEPPELPGLAIVEDRFVRERPRVLAVPYGRAIKSYAFCGYRAYR